MAQIARAARTTRMSVYGDRPSVATPLSRRRTLTDAVEEVGGESDVAWLID
jgi:hypothetical protein